MTVLTAIAGQSSRYLVATYTLTLITSAALLFWVQPMIAKFILPSVGGAPAVWNTAMMFFQAALLTGYVYAHLLSKHLSARVQIVVHVGLLLVCLAWLPIAVPPGTQPPETDAATLGPSWWVLGVLTASVGAPFAIVAGSAPLLQTWFANSGHRDADNPYFLYAASNAGSMSALLGFPLVAEPLLDLNGQSFAWSLGFAALILFTMLSGGLAWRTGNAVRSQGSIRPKDVARPTPILRFLWLALVLTSTSLMLGVTTHITTDVAAVPLLWVVPLALYLLTFIITFARKPIVGAERATQMLLIALLLLAGLWLTSVSANHWLLWAGALVAVYFITVLAIHSELAKLKPHKAWLTEFYLWIALGGMLGGMFNAVVAPLLFQGATEFALMTGVAVALVLSARAVARGNTPKPMLALAAFCIAAPISAEHMGLLTPREVLTRERNFFGVLSVIEDQELQTRALRYGTTAHGMRDLRPGEELEPVGYYGRTSPLGDVMKTIARRPKSGEIAAIGLGVGAIACHDTGGRKITFFEINPAVTALAEHPEHFGFLKGCGTDYGVIHGDGRLKISAMPNGGYDLIFLDAFTSDSIPVHLLTVEAFRTYLDKLSPGGVVLAHISNNHLNLAPAMAAVAHDLGLHAMHRMRTAKDRRPGTNRLIDAQAHMVVLARKPDDLRGLKGLAEWRPLLAASDARAWTDSYTNIAGALKIFNGN